MAYGNNRFLQNDDDDPISAVANLFDVAMVFAVALIVAMVSFMKMTDFFTEDEVTIVKNPGKKDMEIIRKKGEKIEKFKADKNPKTNGSSGNGRKIGVAYELENGEIIYIPE